MWLHLITLLIVFSSSIANTASLPESEKQTICQQRPRCQIERVYPAGKATNGVSLQVIKVVLNLSKEEQKETEEDFTKGCRASDSDKKNGGEEYWLLERQQTPRKILTLCNDGYGASGVGIAPFPNVETWSATDEQNRTVRVLKLHWQQEYALTYGFLLAYAQAEVGKQVRTVANAGITRNRPDYLPYNKSISDGCRVENRRVELIREVDLPLAQQ